MTRESVDCWRRSSLHIVRGMIFHAAAHKHVPLLEGQPLAAIANNIFATESVVAAAAAHGARVVLLSTDKAVAPASVMGATKRVAEEIVLRGGGTVLRLGNVLASSGSVAEVFAEQIARGGPLTVTDPAVRRYFLTMDEAVNLLLLAAAHPEASDVAGPGAACEASHCGAGGVYGAQTRSRLERFRSTSAVCAPAINLSNSCGRAPIRHSPSPAAILAVIRIRPPIIAALQSGLATLRDAVGERDLGAALSQLRALVPEYHPSQSGAGTCAQAWRRVLRMSSASCFAQPRGARIGVVTTSRADYSHLYWPLRELAARPEIELGVFVLGPHLSPEFGNTLREIERDGFPIQARIECLLSSDTDTGMAKTIGVAILGLADALDRVAARSAAADRRSL